VRHRAKFREDRLSAILDFQKLEILTSGLESQYASSLSPRRSWQRDIARYYVKNRNIFAHPALSTTSISVTIYMTPTKFGERIC